MKKWINLLSLVFVLMFIFVNIGYTKIEAVEKPKKVLLLYSYDKLLPIYEILDPSIRSNLKSKADISIEFYVEYLDLSRFSEYNYQDRLLSFLHSKYSKLTIDLIVTVNPPAFELLLRDKDHLFKDIPVVFCSIGEIRLKDRKLENKNFTGILSDEDQVKWTLNEMIKIHPDVRKIAVIAGTSDTDRGLLQEAQPVFKQRENSIDFIYLNNLTLDRLLIKVKNLPHHTLCLYLTFFCDAIGKSYVPRDVLTQISQIANVPIYSYFSPYLEYGIVGGYLHNFQVEGEKVADLAIRILNGEKPSDIPYERSVSNFMFDWNQLKRWGILEEKLPTGSIIPNKVESFWEQYKWRIGGVFGLCLFEALLIFVLLVNLKKRHRAEIALQQAHDELERKVDERTRKLYNLLKQKEVLVKEVHHRVKNNFMVISSLLNLQSKQIKNKKALELFKESQGRINTMAFIHEKLYKSADLASIDFKDYLSALTQSLYESYAVDPSSVILKMNIENVPLGVDQAIPCSLIVNELISNALKYAFPDARKGKINLSLIKADTKEIELLVTDNGIGLPKDFDIKNTQTLGMHLVKILAESQLQGKLTVKSGQGSEFLIKFNVQ